MFCIVDDSISSKTKPSSQALHPIEDAYFHQSHLKGKQDYGHQAVAVMLSCNGIVLNYAIVMYDKSKSKVKIVQEIAHELSIPPVISYFLCDSWYRCGGIMDAFIQKGFYTIGALKTNRFLYPCGIKQKISEFALHLRKTDVGVSIRRHWLMMSLAHLTACTGCGGIMSFEDRYAYICSHIQEERLRFIYQCGARHVLFEEVLALVA